MILLSQAGAGSNPVAFHRGVVQWQDVAWGLIPCA